MEENGGYDDQTAVSSSREKALDNIHGKSLKTMVVRMIRQPFL